MFGVQYMLSTFLLATAPQQILCTSSVVADINARLSTLSEHLFDAAEEHVLTVLLNAWADACANDFAVFRKVSVMPFAPQAIPSILTFFSVA